MAGDEEVSDAAVRVPTIGLVAVATAVAVVPFVHPAVSATDGVLRWLLWIVAGLAFLYLLLSARRVYADHGLAAVVRWIVTGTLPRN